MYSLGDEWLDRLLGRIEPGSVVLVLGYPGAGKTSFAARMVYTNAVEKKAKSLYISFSETKEKFFKFMSRLGLDFVSLESEGLFWFVEMPLRLGKGDFKSLSHLISGLASEGDFSIVVIDTVNPLLERARSRSEARGFLHDLLYRPISRRRGVLVLVAELPLGREALGLGGIEFVADAVLVFKSKMLRSEVLRYIEVRKFRGSPVKAYRIPFSIGRGGFRTLLGPVLAGLRAEPNIAGIYSTGCGLIDEAWSPAPGRIIMVSLTPSAPLPHTLVELLVSLIAQTQSKPILVAFSPVYSLFLEEIASRIESAETVIPYVLFNPYEVMDELVTRVHKGRHGVAVLAGLGALLKSFPDSSTDILNLVGSVLLWLKESGVMTFIVTCNTNMQELLSEYVDVVHEVKGMDSKVVHTIVRKAGPVIEMEDEELQRCCSAATS